MTGLGRRTQSAVGGISYIRHNLSSAFFCNENYEVVIHCAALASPWASPASYKRNNIDATQNIYNYCVHNKVRHLIYISSSSVLYRDGDQFNLNEKDVPPEPKYQINNYSKSKLIGEQLIKSFPGTLSILRPRAVFGPGDTVLLPRIVEAAKKNRLVRLTRSDSKKAVGDLIYIDTLSQYICSVVEKKVSGTFNLTNHEPVEIEKFLHQLLIKLGIPPPQRSVPAKWAYYLAGFAEWISKIFFNYKEPTITRFGISVLTQSKTFDPSLTLKVLGRPAVSLEDGIKNLLKWWKR